MTKYREQDQPVTVVMAVHNGAPFIAEAIKSLSQVSGLKEIILVDDACTDQSPTIAMATAKECKVALRCFRAKSNQPIGPSAARNLGARKVCTPLIWFFDADDICEIQGPDPRLNLIGISGDVIVGSMRYLEHGSHPPKYSQPRHCPSTNLLYLTTEAFRSVGGFNEDLRFGEDVDLLVRLVESGYEVTSIDVLVFSYRQHQDSLTNSIPSAKSQGMLAAVRARLSRINTGISETGAP